MMTERGYVLREHVHDELGSIVALLCRNNVLNCEKIVFSILRAIIVSLVDHDCDVGIGLFPHGGAA